MRKIHFLCSEAENQKSDFRKKNEQKQSLLVPSVGNVECRRAARGISSEKDT